MRDDKLLTRIGGLLRQAEGTDNPHEAEAFLAAAQRLATASSIDLAVARSHDPALRTRSTPISRKVTIGPAGKRGLRTYVQLFVHIGRANDLTCDVASNSTYVIAYGFESDLDTVEALYASLVVQMVAASDAYLKSGAYKGQTAQQLVTRDIGPWRRRVVESKTLSPITARLNFHSAFAERVGQRLLEARDEQRRTAIELEQAVAGREQPTDSGQALSSSTAVALRNKELEVADFYRHESTARGTWRPSRAGAGYSSAARQAGDRAGRRAKIGADPELGGARGALER
ncbi:hypothetical protein GOHSU_08_00960 [Gordonia hirsuta DSM 44140 = NBRC 16056]|uniref:DUF2786 domain-containing protein n=1 Tax=Gordonia hirsuta DSM 44140 = NBRC 16056 TaxID=1121927 RepID=L7L968_9ACTN|nr:DUF2786 domain-containing protein [Gordonia hirsuta]GAC56568.1 hypothetical protein GOHSU_08_00960 [Gordonia hirsuta DSM 44140 = NBRC 16056]